MYTSLFFSSTDTTTTAFMYIALPAQPPLKFMNVYILLQLVCFAALFLVEKEKRDNL